MYNREYHCLKFSIFYHYGSKKNYTTWQIILERNKFCNVNNQQLTLLEPKYFKIIVLRKYFLCYRSRDEKVPNDWNKYLLEVLKNESTFNWKDFDSKILKIWKEKLLMVLDCFSKFSSEVSYNYFVVVVVVVVVVSDPNVFLFFSRFIQVYKDNECKKIFNNYCSYVIHLLNCTMSVNIASTQLDRHFVCLINDHKMTRMCFSYLKQVDMNSEFFFSTHFSRFYTSLLISTKEIKILDNKIWKKFSNYNYFFQSV